MLASKVKQACRDEDFLTLIDDMITTTSYPIFRIYQDSRDHNNNTSVWSVRNHTQNVN